MSWGRACSLKGQDPDSQRQAEISSYSSDANRRDFHVGERTLENNKDTHFNSTEAEQAPKYTYIICPVIFMCVQ